MGLERQLAVPLGDGQKPLVADGGALGLARQAHGAQDRAQGHAVAALQHVLQGVIGKFNGVDGEALGLGGDGLRRRVLHGVQSVGGQLAVIVLGDVIDAGLQVRVRHLRKREGHGDGKALGGLELAALGVDHLDVEGVGLGDVHIVRADLLYGGVGLDPGRRRHLPNAQHSVRRERARLGLHRDDHAVHGLGPGEGYELRFLGCLVYCLRGSLVGCLRVCLDDCLYGLFLGLLCVCIDSRVDDFRSILSIGRVLFFGHVRFFGLVLCLRRFLGLQCYPQLKGALRLRHLKRHALGGDEALGPGAVGIGTRGEQPVRAQLGLDGRLPIDIEDRHRGVLRRHGDAHAHNSLRHSVVHVDQRRVGIVQYVPILDIGPGVRLKRHFFGFDRRFIL